MIVSASDGASTLMGKLFAAVVEYSEWWKAVFPNVVPDQQRGWGAEGYFIKDSRMDYAKFVDMCMSDHMRDPSFVGAGITSSDIVGKHPSVFLLLDDIHDENNTRSKKEREAVIDSLKANLLPTMSRPGERPYIAVAFTPWTMDDAYAYLKETGLLRSVKTPVYEDKPEGRVYSWPQAFDEKEVEKWRKALGSVEFGRMYLLDLEKTGERIRYQDYAASLVQYNWVMIGGIDPINSLPGGMTEPTSNFALAYVAKCPAGGAVVVGGVLKKCSELEAENEIVRAQTIFPNWLFSASESVGGGSLFIQMMRRNPSIRIIESNLRWVEKQGQIRSKRDRLLLEMFPWFENGVVKISDEDTPFLNALRNLFKRFYTLDPKTSPEFDAGDSVYHALKAMPDVLNIQAITGEELPQPGLNKKVKKIEANRAFMFGRL